MSQWSRYGLPDPLIPFSEERLVQLQENLRKGASDSSNVVTRMVRLTSQRSGPVWSGPAADGFFSEIGDLPEDLTKLIQSYGLGYTAVSGYLAVMRELRTKAESHLDFIHKHETRIDSVRWQLAAVPFEDEDQRRELELEVESLRDSVNYVVGQARVVLGYREGAADEFKKEMNNAQVLGIHNRNILVRIYEDKVEIYAESFIGAWEDLGPWADVLLVALMFVPGGQVVTIVVKGLKALEVAAVTLQTVDILLSDDEADAAFFVDAGMTAIGLGAAAGKWRAGKKVIKNWENGISLIATGGRRAASMYKYVSRIDTVVDVVGDVVGTARSAYEITDRLGSGTLWSSDSVWSPKVEDAPFEDPLWTADRLILAPLILTPTLVDVEVDVTVRQSQSE